MGSLFLIKNSIRNYIVRRKALTTKQSQNSQEPMNVANTEIVVSEADKIAAKLSAGKFYILILFIYNLNT